MNDKDLLLEQGQKRKKKRTPIGYIIAIVSLSIITLASLGIAYLSTMNLKNYIDEDKQTQTTVGGETNKLATYTQEELDSIVASEVEDAKKEAIEQYRTDLKETAEKSNGIISILRTMYPDYFVFYNKDHYEFTPIDESLPKPNFKNENIVANEGFLEYQVNGETKSIKGIDVSKYQGDIKWNKVADSGVKYAIIRVGIRGYETGKLVLDENFEDNIKGATDAGLDVGVYFVTQATSDAEAREEAAFVLEAIDGYTLKYGVALDIEEVNKEEARTYKLTKDERTQYAKTFVDTVEAAGVKGVIYGNLVTFGRLLNINDLGNYSKWFALYDSKIYFPYEVDMWQYSDSGSIDGIDGKVDVNITFPKE